MTINVDRSIIVRQGDWLSKYSMAIYGDFNHINKFKKKLGTRYLKLDNPDLIHTGEILYHPDPLPGESRSPSGGETPEGEPPIQASNVAEFLKWVKQTFLTTEWKVEGTAGGDISLSFLCAQYATIGMRNTRPRLDPEPQIRWYHAIAGGLTLGYPDDVSVGGSFSVVQFASAGTILRSPLYHRLTFDDFRGYVIVVEVGGAFLVWGGSVTLLFFGMIGAPERIITELGRFLRYGDHGALRNLLFRALPGGVALFAGANIGLPGVAIAGRVGFMHDLPAWARR